MRAIPLFWSSDLKRSVAFYTNVLEFKPRWPEHFDFGMQSGVMDLICDGAVIELSIHMGRNPTPSSANIELETAGDVDAAFSRFTARGLDQSHRMNSPVHLAPLDQTWGTREVYVDDPEGNCLCFRAWR